MAGKITPELRANLRAYRAYWDLMFTELHIEVSQEVWREAHRLLVEERRTYPSMAEGMRAQVHPDRFHELFLAHYFPYTVYGLAEVPYYRNPEFDDPED